MANQKIKSFYLNIFSNNNTHYSFNHELNVHKWNYFKASGFIKDIYYLIISPIDYGKLLNPSLGVKNPQIN